MNIYELTLNDYLAVASSKSSTPGGGSVSAVVAANAAAMISMVGNLTINRKGYDEVQEEVREILDVMEKLISEIKELTQKDIQSFLSLMEAWRLPSTTEEEKSKKKEAINKTAQAASLVPLDLSKTCLDILVQAKRLAPIGNKGAISDVGVGVYLAEAALRASMLSVDINLPLISDDAFKASLLAEKARLIVEAEELKLIALSDVKKRM